MNALWRMLMLSALVTPGWCDIRVQDDLDREIRLSAPASRILTLAPHATEMILAAGAGKNLVAVAQFSSYPPSLDRIPRINTLGSLDREYILDTNPDLVIAWASGNRQADLRWLEQTGIPVFMSEPTSLADIASSLEKLGALAGKPEAGHEAAERFTADLDRACTGSSSADRRPAYYEIWADPPMTIGGKHWLNEVLERAGLKNIFADVPRLVFTLNPESLMARKVSVLITSQPDASRPVDTAHIYRAGPELGRPGPRLAEGLKSLCAQM
jgi:iron complex transport system substrate-binding protein